MLSFILVFDRILVKMCWDHDHWVGSRRCQGKLKISTCSLVGLVITWTDYEVNKTFETASARVHRLTDVSCFFLLVCTFCIIENEYIYIYIYIYQESCKFRHPKQSSGPESPIPANHITLSMIHGGYSKVEGTRAIFVRLAKMKCGWAGLAVSLLCSTLPGMMIANWCSGWKSQF